MKNNLLSEKLIYTETVSLLPICTYARIVRQKYRESSGNTFNQSKIHGQYAHQFGCKSWDERYGNHP